MEKELNKLLESFQEFKESVLESQLKPKESVSSTNETLLRESLTHSLILFQILFRSKTLVFQGSHFEFFKNRLFQHLNDFNETFVDLSEEEMKSTIQFCSTFTDSFLHPFVVKLSEKERN